MGIPTRFNRILLKRLGSALGLAMLAGGPAFAGNLVITPTFAANVDTFFGANAGAFKNAFNIAAANFTNVYNDPIHVNIAVDAVSGTSILGQSSTSIFSLSYTSLRNAVFTDAKTSDDLVTTGAGGSVSSTSTDPLGASTHNYWVTKAQRKALGLAADDLSSDGTVTLGAGFLYDFDPSNGVAAGAIDIVGVFMHEISEVMGRIGISGGNVAGAPSYTLLDLLSYKSAGVRGMGNDGGNWLSIDNGSTLLKQFNNNAALGGDSRDWASGSIDSFNAFSTSGVVSGFTAVDVRAMDVIGYDLATPEPASVVLMLSALTGLALLRRRKAMAN